MLCEFDLCFDFLTLVSVFLLQIDESGSIYSNSLPIGCQCPD